MKRVLVTGVAGFIGSKVSKMFLNKGYAVVGIDNLSTGVRDVVPEGVKFIEGGVHKEAAIKALEGEEFNIVCHIAGQSGGEMSYDDPVYDLQSNTQSTLLLLDLCRKVKCESFIYTSTCSVYGEKHDTDMVDEEQLLTPNSFYGVGKLASEHYLRLYASQFGLNCTSLRLFNIYGPGQNLDNLKQGMVSIYLAQALKSRKILVKGSSERFRDFVYVDDVVELFSMLDEAPRKGYSVYNVSTGVKTQVASLLKQLDNALPFKVEIEYGAGTPGDITGICGNMDKIHNEVGWLPRTEISKGVELMVTWGLQTKSS